MQTVRFAAYLLVSLAVGMVAREFTRSFVATRLNDPTPRLWGRLSLNPKTWFDPFGSGLLPGLILILWAGGASYLPPPFAYAKPAAIDPARWRRPARDAVAISLAGPASNALLAAGSGGLLRIGPSGEAALMLIAFTFTNLSLAIFHLMPIPGLDGARVVALALPPRAREIYRQADQYLPLFILVVFFVFAGPLLSIVDSLSNGLCRVFSGAPCFPLPFL